MILCHESSRTGPLCASSLLFVTLLLCPFGVYAANSAETSDYVGREACAPCHKSILDRYAGSHHDRAMQPAGPDTVLGDFNGATYQYNGLTSVFFKKDGGYFVRTDGSNGELEDFRISYTLGIAPLQQYLIAFPDGRMQALGIAWDTRPREEGGQRWFHLYPGEKVDHRDLLHWTGAAQNWNFMCAECHSTGVRKNYDAQADRFATRWSEVDVSCEACHGPGSAHVAWAAAQKNDSVSSDPTKGLSVQLGLGPGTWRTDPAKRTATLAGERDTRAQIETCGRCHSRRAQISEESPFGRDLAQTHLVSLLDAPLYDADGQIRDEVYEYGSFLQSRMYMRSVACTDCHDPHSGKLHAEGNALCGRCHSPAAFDTVSHHHHPPGPGTHCINCHMRQRDYMVIHRRHDHSFRVPRPDLSTSLGSRDTCTDCHKDRSANWAAEAIVRWYGPQRARGGAFGPALAAGRRQQAGAVPMLARVIRDQQIPAIVRATALTLAGQAGEALAAITGAQLSDPDPLVRRAALEALAGWSPQRRLEVAMPLLSDPVRGVRLEAVDVLADVVATAPLTPERRRAFDAALAEYRAVQEFNADRPEAWMNLGSLDARMGQRERAETAYLRAIRMQPRFIPAYVNLADLYREMGRDVDGERILRQALVQDPGAAEVRLSLGLLQVRQKKLSEALVELGKTVELAPGMAHYAYVYAIALDSVGQRDKARECLEDAHRRFTGNREILSALVQFAAQAGDRDAATHWAMELRKLDMEAMSIR